MPPDPTDREQDATQRVQPRPTQEGLVVTGPQRWPWYDDQAERSNKD